MDWCERARRGRRGYGVVGVLWRVCGRRDWSRDALVERRRECRHFLARAALTRGQTLRAMAFRKILNPRCGMNGEALAGFHTSSAPRHCRFTPPLTSLACLNTTNARILESRPGLSRRRLQTQRKALIHLSPQTPPPNCYCIGRRSEDGMRRNEGRTRPARSRQFRPSGLRDGSPTSEHGRGDSERGQKKLRLQGADMHGRETRHCGGRRVVEIRMRK